MSDRSSGQLQWKFSQFPSSRVPRDWKTWKSLEIKLVMEKASDIINLQKVMEFCDQSWNLTNFSHEFDQICTFFLDLEKSSISLESLHFTNFSADCYDAKFEQR